MENKIQGLYVEAFRHIYEFLQKFKTNEEFPEIKKIPKGQDQVKLVLLANLIIGNQFDETKIFDALSEQSWSWIAKILDDEKKRQYAQLYFIIQSLLEKK